MIKLMYKWSDEQEVEIETLDDVVAVAERMKELRLLQNPREGRVLESVEAVNASATCTNCED